MIISSKFAYAELIGNHYFGMYGKIKKKNVSGSPPPPLFFQGSSDYCDRIWFWVDEAKKKELGAGESVCVCVCVCVGGGVSILRARGFSPGRPRFDSRSGRPGQFPTSQAGVRSMWPSESEVMESLLCPCMTV